MHTTKKKIVLLFSVVLIFPFSLSAQQDSTKVYLLERGTFDELSLITGYSFNGANEKAGIDNHIVELGIYKSRNSYYTETAGYSYFLSNEFMFNKNSFYLGPKIGGFFHFGIFYAGAELVYYTNFKGQALHIVPIFGLGYSRLKIGLGFHASLANNLFEYTNVPSIGFTYEVKNLRKRKIDY